jgi:hypothetical protein
MVSAACGSAFAATAREKAAITSATNVALSRLSRGKHV